MAETFGEAVMRIKAEDTQLRKTLTADEQIVRQSTNKMQGDLNKLTVSTVKNQQATASAGQVFGAFGAQVSAVGGKVGEVGGKVAGLGGALAGLGPALLGPAGAILALTAGLSAIISHFVSAKQKAEELRKEMEELNQATGDYNKTLGQTAQTAERRARALAAELKGPEALIREQGRALEEDLARREKQLSIMLSGQAPGTGRKALEKELQAVFDLRISVAESTATKLRQIEETRRQRELGEEKAFQQQIAAERKQRETAAVSAFGQTAMGKVVGAMKGLFDKENLERDMKAILEGPAFKGLGELKDTLLQTLGLAEPALVVAGGAMGRAGGVQAGAFRGGIAAGAVSTGTRQEETRTKDVGEMKKMFTQLMTFVSGGGLGGGGSP